MAVATGSRLRDLSASTVPSRPALPYASFWWNTAIFFRPRLVSWRTMSSVSSLYEARRWKASRLNGWRRPMAPVKGAKKGTSDLKASGSAATLVGVPM